MRLVIRTDLSVSLALGAAPRVVSLIGSPRCCSARAAAFGDDELFERVEARLPERAVVLDPIRRSAKRSRTECAPMLAPHDGAVHQTCTLEHTQMFRHR